MITGFELYTPKAWSDMYGLMVSGKPHKTNTHSQRGSVRRAVKKWNTTTLHVTVGVANLVIGSLFLSSYCGAVAAPPSVPKIHDLDAARSKSSKTVVLSPIRQINQSFNKLFDSIQTGQMLIPSDNIRLLSRNALISQKQNVDIDSWAQNLANDIKVAND